MKSHLPKSMSLFIRSVLILGSTLTGFSAVASMCVEHILGKQSLEGERLPPARVPQEGEILPPSPQREYKPQANRGVPFKSAEIYPDASLATKGTIKFHKKGLARMGESVGQRLAFSSMGGMPRLSRPISLGQRTALLVIDPQIGKGNANVYVVDPLALEAKVISETADPNFTPQTVLHGDRAMGVFVKGESTMAVVDLFGGEILGDIQLSGPIKNVLPETVFHAPTQTHRVVVQTNEGFELIDPLTARRAEPKPLLEGPKKSIVDRLIGLSSKMTKSNGYKSIFLEFFKPLDGPANHWPLHTTIVTHQGKDYLVTESHFGFDVFDVNSQRLVQSIRHDYEWRLPAKIFESQHHGILIALVNGNTLRIMDALNDRIILSYSLEHHNPPDHPTYGNYQKRPMAFVKRGAEELLLIPLDRAGKLVRIDIQRMEEISPIGKENAEDTSSSVESMKIAEDPVTGDILGVMAVTVIRKIGSYLTSYLDLFDPFSGSTTSLNSEIAPEFFTLNNGNWTIGRAYQNSGHTNRPQTPVALLKKLRSEISSAEGTAAGVVGDLQFVETAEGLHMLIVRPNGIEVVGYSE